NNGCIEAKTGFLQGLREVCDRYGIALIFDEVITGFRLGLGGAQRYYNITPDLSIFAKAIASGYPISAIVGKREWMEEMVSARVIHAGTMNTSTPTVAAALATIEVLERDPDTYKRMFRLGKKLMDGFRSVSQKVGQNLFVQGTGPMFNTSFTSLPDIRNYRDTLHTDKVKLRQFIAGLHDRGIRVIGRGLWYISAVHTDEDIEQAIKVAAEVLKEID